MTFMVLSKTLVCKPKSVQKVRGGTNNNYHLAAFRPTYG